MRRAAGILLGILLGALAAGIGIGIFLKKANDDRRALAEHATKTTETANRIREENARAIQAANKKLDDANTEVTKAQELIQALKTEREIIARTPPLAQPSARTLKTWGDAVNVYLNVSLKIPPTSSVETNDANAFTIHATNTRDNTSNRWISITPYDERLEQNLLETLSTSTSVTYVVHGFILEGKEGIASDNALIHVLHVRNAGSFSHVIWMRTVAPAAERTALDVLSTLQFKP